MDREGSTDLGGIGNGADGSAPLHPSRAQPGGGLCWLSHRPAPCCHCCSIRGRAVIPEAPSALGESKPPTQGAEAETTAATPPMTAYGGMAKVHLGDDCDGYLLEGQNGRGVGLATLPCPGSSLFGRNAAGIDRGERPDRHCACRKAEDGCRMPEGTYRPGVQGSATHARALGGRVSNRDPEA